MSSNHIEKAEGGRSGGYFLRHPNGDVQLGAGCESGDYQRIDPI